MTSVLTVKLIGNAKSLTDAVDGADRSLAGLAGAAGKIGLAFGAAAVGVGVGLFQIGNQFDEARNIITAGAGAMGADLEALFDNTTAVLAQVPESADVVAGALADVNTFFGQTGDQLETSTQSFLDFARVADVDLNTAISGADALFTQFGESSENLDEVLGDLLRISQATGAPVGQLLGQMETFGPIFANAGFSIEDTAAILGQLEQAGVDLTRVGPALNKFFRDAAAAGEEPQAALAATVLEIENAETAADALNIATTAFGAEGAQRMVNAIASGNFDLETFNGLLGEGTGLVGEQAAATASFSDKLNIFKNQVLVALEPVATRVFEAVGNALESIGPKITVFAEQFAEVLPVIIDKVEPAIRSVVAGVQAAIAVFQGGDITSDEGFIGFAQRAGAILRTVVDFLVEYVPPAVRIAGAVFIAVFDFLSEYLPPIIEKIIEVVGTVVAWIEENWPPIRDTILEVVAVVVAWFEENWPKISEVIGNVFVIIQEIIGFIAEVITTFITNAQIFWDTFGSTIIAATSLAWNHVSGVISGVVQIITGIIQVFSSALTGDWSGLWEGVKSIVSGALTIVQTTISTTFSIVSGIVTTAMSGIQTTISGYWDSIITFLGGLGGKVTGAVSGMFDGIATAFKSAINAVIDGWNGLSFSIPGFDSGIPGVPSFGGTTLSLPTIPRLAEGGVAFAPKLVMIGDNIGAGTGDPEIAAPQSFLRDAVTDGIAAAGGAGPRIVIEQFTTLEGTAAAEIHLLEVLYA